MEENEKLEEKNDELYRIKEDKIEPEKEKNFKKFQIVARIFALLLGLFISYEAIEMLATSNNLVMLPYISCLLLMVVIIVARIFNKKVVEGFAAKLCVTIFLLLWLGFVAFATYTTLKTNEKSLVIYMMLTLLWIVGFFLIYKYLIKKK